MSQIETAPGVSLYVERYGEGPNVIIIPARLYLAQDFRTLAAPDRTLILYDMRNRGASTRVNDGAQLTILEDVRDLEAIRAHSGAERVALIGYSYLGLMVALYAAEHPDRIDRIVQIGPVPRRFGTEYPPDQVAGPDSLSPEGREAFAAVDRAPGSMDQRDLCRLQQTAINYLIVGNPANASRIPDVCQYENEWPANFDRHLGFHFADIQTRDFPVAMFEQVAVPVLTLHGTLDRNAPYGAGREWASTFPNGRLITLEGAAHQGWVDDPAVISEIDEFLRGQWPARAEDLTP